MNENKQLSRAESSPSSDVINTPFVQDGRGGGGQKIMDDQHKGLCKPYQHSIDK